MYNILPETKDYLIAIRVEGVMTSQDYQTLLPYLKSRIEQHGRIRVLVELKDFKGIEILGLLRTLPYVFKYGRRVQKKAILTDEPWVYRWAKLFTPFYRTKVRCFPTTEGEQARDWIRR